MRRPLLIFGFVVAMLAFAPAASVRAQSFSSSPCPEFHDDSGGGWFFHRMGACELRRTTLLPNHGQVDVSGANGAIEVVGEDRSDVLLEARVEAHGSSQGDAASLLHQINIVTAGTIHAEGPSNSGWFHVSEWSVSYKLRVPRRVNASLHTVNGSIQVSDVGGAVTAATTNGAIALGEVTGEVQAQTVNGGITIALDDSRSHSAGVSARTVNGGIAVKAPENYSAHLTAQTVNGAISVAFPITVQGRIGRQLDTNIGHGGPTLALQTVNGGISVAQAGRGPGREE